MPTRESLLVRQLGGYYVELKKKLDLRAWAKLKKRPERVSAERPT